MNRINIGFIGYGNIAKAIIGGCVKSGYIRPENVFVFDTDSLKTECLEDTKFKVSLTAMELVSACDYIFLTVKPNVYDIVLSEIGEAFCGKCIVSVAAGITIEYIKKTLRFDASVIRVMPNTPLIYGCGASALVKANPVSDDQYSFIKGIFSCSGVVVDVDESDINCVTAISGSMPAFVMRFIKTSVDFALSKGISEADAYKLILQTVKGSALLIENSTESIDVLIQNVTSPNGTTEAGLKILDRNGFDNSLAECLENTYLRAKELTK